LAEADKKAGVFYRK